MSETVDKDNLYAAQIVWTGDLDDDCTAKWRGLVLRAECMGCDDEDCEGTETCTPEHGAYWWWEVTEKTAADVVVFASSNGDGAMDNGKPAGQPSGALARVAAEAAAWRILYSRKGSPPQPLRDIAPSLDPCGECGNTGWFWDPGPLGEGKGSWRFCKACKWRRT